MFGPQMRDAALGVYNTAVSAGGPDTTAPKLTNITDGPDPFTPLGKTKKKTTMKFTLGEKAFVSFTIRSKSGSVVAKIPTASLNANRYSVIWNGRRLKSGKVVKAGIYTYKIVAKDLAGNAASRSGKVRVKR